MNPCEVTVHAQKKKKKKKKAENVDVRKRGMQTVTMCDTSQINEAQLNRETICFLREKQSLKSEE